jgi:hypothetical protein
MAGMKENPVSDVINEELTHQNGEEPSETLSLVSEQAEDRIDRKPAYATFPAGTTAVSVFAVVDANGYLIPIFTAADLLREFKALWKAAQY